MDIDNYMTPAEAAYRYDININALKEKMKERNIQQVELMVAEGLIKSFVAPGKVNRSWILSAKAIEIWFPKQFKEYHN